MGIAEQNIYQRLMRAGSKAPLQGFAMPQNTARYANPTGGGGRSSGGEGSALSPNDLQALGQFGSLLGQNMGNWGKDMVSLFAGDRSGFGLPSGVPLINDSAGTPAGDVLGGLANANNGMGYEPVGFWDSMTAIWDNLTGPSGA